MVGRDAISIDVEARQAWLAGYIVAASQFTTWNEESIEAEAERQYARLVPAEDEGRLLDTAWAEAEATQEYGRIRSLVEYKDGWEAVWTDGRRVVGEFGHTPVEALRALRAALAATPEPLCEHNIPRSECRLAEHAR